MSEAGKSLIYVAVAAVSVLLAIVTAPRPTQVDTNELIGQPLFQELTDPSAARSLKIVNYDEGQGQLNSFEVRQIDGQWVLPSDSNYPADAENRIRDAATTFAGLTVIGVQSNSDAERATYGVLEPNDENRQKAAEGVGTLLEMEGANGQPFRLVVGAEVQGTEGQQRFVRIPSQSTIYVAKIDLTKFPSNFKDWINRDLLDINTFDISKLILKDYSVQTGVTLDGRIAVTDYDQRFELAVHEEAGKWQLDELQEFRDGQLVPSQLTEGEQLSETRLDGLRDALEELTIVDVERKPEGLRADLTASQDFLNRNDSLQSLVERGFFPVKTSQNGPLELLSSDGEVVVQMKSGVEYVLRFGGINAAQQTGEDAQLNRFLFVSARVNKSLIPEPTYQQVPGGSGTDGNAPASPGGPSATGSETAVPDAPGANAPAPESSGAASESQDPAKANGTGDATPAADDSSSHLSQNLPTRLVTAQAEQTTTDGDAATDAAATDTGETDSTDPSAQAEDAVEQNSAAADAESSESPAASQMEAERARIIRENQRKMDEYNEKIAKAETTANDANFRFAEWYYVISEDVYKKIHLSRSDVITVSDAGRADSIESTRSLLEGGLEGGLQGGLPDGLDGGSSPLPGPLNSEP